MSAGGSRALACGESWIRRACRRLPEPAREEREREWIAELPAILDDPDTRFAVVRVAKAMLFAFGVAKVARCAPKPTKVPRVKRANARRGRSSEEAVRPLQKAVDRTAVATCALALLGGAMATVAEILVAPPSWLIMLAGLGVVLTNILLTFRWLRERKKQVGE